MYKFIALLGILVLTAHQKVSFAQGSELSIETIMQGDDFIGYLPEYHRTLPNDDVIFEWRSEDDKKEYTYVYIVNTGVKRKLTPKELATFPLHGFTWSKNKTEAIYAVNGNLFVWKTQSTEPLLLIKTTDYISSPYYATDDLSVFYTVAHNLYEYQLSSGVIEQIVDFTKGVESDEDKKDNYLERQQKELFEIVKKRDEKSQLRKDEGDLLKPYSIPKIYIGDADVYQTKISPNEYYVIFSTIKRANATSTEIHEYVNPNGVAKEVKARPKVGRDEDVFKLSYFDIKNREVIDLEIDELSNLNKNHKYNIDYGRTSYENKGVIFHGPYFNDKGDIAVVEIKSLDNKHRWLTRIDFKNKKLVPFEYQYDEAWIGGPGISSWNEAPGNIGFLKKSNTCYFQSEETGYSHLYTFDFDKDKKKQLTKGEFEIHDATLSSDGSKFFITANKKHAGNREFYHFDIDAGKWTDILVKDGKYDVVTNKDESKLYYLYSYKNKPTELYTSLNTPKEDAKQLTSSTTESFDQCEWLEPEIITFKATDGADVPARLYKPIESKKNKAAVIFVHGAGYLQNAHNWWSGYYREYMFHNFLVKQGYTVLDIDYRASAGYGRDWRTAIYRDMGGKDLSDQVDGRKYLVEQLGIDENKVGIYGGSYGGFITIMALLKEPGKFQCGGAIRSVTDWAHYNHEYTSNILNTPETDSVAFRRSSPIYYAENLKDKLLMLHGMMDDNVQFQDVVRLTQRFIELGRDSYEMAIYPIEPHGFRETSSWTDEYKRIYKLFEENLLGK